MAGKCNCPASGTDKLKEKCEPPSNKSKSQSSAQVCKPGFDKSKKKEKEGKCHESRKKFLEDMEKNQCNGKENKGKCHQSHQEFHKKDDEKDSKCSGQRSTPSPCGGGRSSSSTSEDASKSRPTVCCSSQQGDTDCQQSHKEFQESPCSAKEKHMPKKSGSCPSICGQEGASQSKSKSTEYITCSAAKNPCESKQKDDGSLYSKFSSCCKNLAKDMMKLKSKCVGSDKTEKSLSKKCSKAPPGGPPCPPKLEKRDDLMIKKQTCGVSEEKPPCWQDFFPMDVRNKKLNECVDKYMKIDPKQVVEKCSQFASSSSPKECQNVEKCSGKRDVKCVGTMPSAQASFKPTLLEQLFTPKRRALASHWAPTTGAYLATTGLALLYLTEWRVVLKTLPGFYHLREEPNPHHRDDML